MGSTGSYGNHILFEDDFSTDKGWTGYGQGGWARDTAMASTGCSGGQDPEDDHSPGNDDYIIGTYIGNCYTNTMLQTYWLTSPVINCSGFTSCQLDFWSYSGCESSTWDHCYIDVFNGSAWVNIYTNPNSFFDDVWTHKSYNIPTTALAANLQVRFGIGPTDASVTYSGWNIDDLKITCAGSILVYDTLCTLTYSQQVVVELVSDAENNPESAVMKVYPNPAGDLLYIQTDQEQPLHYVLTDIIGTIISSGPVTGNQTEIKLSTIAPGTYFLKLNNVTYTIVKK